LTTTENFLEEVTKRESSISAYLDGSPVLRYFEPSHIHDLVLAYVKRKAKRLRPAVLLFSCGAAGGDEDMAVPAAAGIELVHTWTLTHDDLIDHDEKRRHEPTVHMLASERARNEFRYGAEASAEYGERVAVLVGDAQHAWSVALFLETPSPPVKPSVVTRIVSLLESQVVLELIRGETLDIQYERADPAALSESEVIEMLRLKTGVLYSFAAMAGAMLGRNTCDAEDPVVHALTEFAGRCGIAFQLQDDILGIVGDEEDLGKPVGSDIREGKRTTIFLHAFANSSPDEKRLLTEVVGNRSAPLSDIMKVQKLLEEKGSIEHTARRAQSYLDQALPILNEIPDSPYRDLLEAWAHYMIEREF
jgi:geranylgeranyl diphosphate synthase type I